MREITGDLWDWLGRSPVVITTNGSLNRRGECPMPRGCAAQARERFPGLPARLGALLRAEGLRVHDLGGGLVSFPVEHHWLDLPDLRLIALSARQLRELADARGWSLVTLPRPGCGGGGLAWAQVRPHLEPWLDQRFQVIERAAGA